jgi:hypothetical protein
MPCSFCNSPSHNITYCNHQLISVYFDNIKETYLSIIALNNSVMYNENLFKMVLNTRFYLRDLRAVGVKYLRVYASTSKSALISILWQYFNSLIWQQEQQTLENNETEEEDTEEDDEVEEESNELPPEDASIISYIGNTYFSYMATMFPNPQPLQPSVNVGYGFPHDLNFHFNMETNDNQFNPQVKKYRIHLHLVKDLVKDFGEDFEDCSICYDNTNCLNLVKLNCNHEFCGCCIKNTLNHHDKLCEPSCALCRQPMSRFTVKNSETYNLIAEHCIL